MRPLRNTRHEHVCLLTCAGFSPADACEHVGLSTDPANVNRLMRRQDVADRVKYLRGEEEADNSSPVDLTAEGIKKQIAELAFDVGTSDNVRQRAFEFLVEHVSKSSDGGYVPQEGEDFDTSKLTPAQRVVCTAYYNHRINTNADANRRALMQRINLIRERHAAAGKA